MQFWPHFLAPTQSEEVNSFVCLLGLVLEHKGMSHFLDQMTHFNENVVEKRENKTFFPSIHLRGTDLLLIKPAP
jgi:hypothetical protein